MEDIVWLGFAWFLQFDVGRQKDAVFGVVSFRIYFGCISDVFRIYFGFISEFKASKKTKTKLHKNKFMSFSFSLPSMKPTQHKQQQQK